MKTKHLDLREHRERGLISPKVRPERNGPRHVELILVGRDLLRGHVADGNAHHVAGLVAGRGDLVHRITIVDDNERAITAALLEALQRNPHLVITTGGLGPAADDRTLVAVAAALGLPLQPHPGARAMVEEGYQRLYRARLVNRAGLNATREKLCRIPVGGRPVSNGVGVTPGVICRLPGGSAVLCLPGKPDEMQAVLEQALPGLKDLVSRRCVARREIESPTADESSLRPLLDRLCEEFPELWISSRPVGSGRKSAKVLVTLEGTASTPEQAEAAANEAVRRLLALASGNI